MGKTFMELEFGRLCWEQLGHDSRILLLAPLAVGRQTLGEAEKFCVEAPVRVAKDQSEVGPGINITNYERLHLFDSGCFDTVIPDEAGILKSYTGATKTALCERFKATRFKLGATATPAPNDRMEIGNHSQFLGVMDSSEMLMRWFINDTMKAGGYRIKMHAVDDFWNWVASWSVCIRKPSDFGYPDDGYDLPELKIIDHVIPSNYAPKGHLYDPGGKVSATNLHDTKRRQLLAKAEKVSELVGSTDEPFVVWVATDYEADAIRPLIKDCIEVRGSQSTEQKERGLTDFSEGRARVIITKPRIGGWGMNWQHCHNMTWFPSFSFEEYYQSVRRLWRYGQLHEVNVHCVMTEAEESISKIARAKEQEHKEMQWEVAARMLKSQRLNGVRNLVESRSPSKLKLPSWLAN